MPGNVFHFEKHQIEKLILQQSNSPMKTITVREMKTHWAEVEAQVRNGETFEILNRGRPTARIIPAKPRPVPVWDDHLATAIPASGRSAEETVAADREERW
jgi:antitoxin (DNA-binding transcriptional repressor) of toxin-antitoxin stability system